MPRIMLKSGAFAMADIIEHSRHCAPDAPRKRARRPRPWLLAHDGFRELRLSLGLSQPACAKALGVCLRTVRHWDRGRNRVPWSAVRLLRLLRGGDLGELSPRWSGWRMSGDLLITPAGVTFGAHEFTWWALTCLQARSWQRAYDRTRLPRPSAGDSLHAGIPVVDGDAFEVCPDGDHGQPSKPDPGTEAPDLLTAVAREPGAGGGGARQRAATAGLVSNATKGTRQGESEAGCGFAGVDVGPQWGQNGATNPTVNGHDGTPKAQPETAPGPARGPARSGGPRVHERECGDGRGPAELGRVPGQASDGPGDYCTQGDPCDWPAVECPFLGCPHRAAHERQCALPVRQRPEVQALPRQGLKVPPPASLAASGDGGCGQHNRARGAQRHDA